MKGRGAVSELPQFLTPEQFAQAMNTTPGTVRQWCRRGAVEAVLVSNVWRIPVSALIRLQQQAERSRRVTLFEMAIAK